VEANRVKEGDADILMEKYTGFIDECVVQHHSQSSHFSATSACKTGDKCTDLAEDGNNRMLCEHMACNSSYSNLWSIVRKLRLLSHGHAIVGFSVNKGVESHNTAGETFTAQLLTCDRVSAVTGIMIVDVANKYLLVSGANTRHKYTS
jgi:hypothetical protein